MKISKLITITLASAFLGVCHAESQAKISQSSEKRSKLAQKKSSLSKPRKCNDVDWIIVGAGTSGVPCAWALTNDKKKSVLLLESGDDHTDDPIIMNPDIFAPTGDGFFGVVAQATAYDPKFAYNDVTAPKTQQSVY